MPIRGPQGAVAPCGPSSAGNINHNPVQQSQPPTIRALVSRHHSVPGMRDAPLCLVHYDACSCTDNMFLAGATTKARNIKTHSASQKPADALMPRRANLPCHTVANLDRTISTPTKTWAGCFRGGNGVRKSFTQRTALSARRFRTAFSQWGKRFNWG